ncbi:tetratricopeptide repeat protein [Actibacterium sp. XHP0104]|uniref:tetratricopeptide repeat protein n=1 Tax=Actibacterium sp. XHP0104 TaxID=2984335 RepID=UPI0021E9736E|nr:tetratricopeptide repeat protein [Actibacterium sp. XHP0104]MCV2881298.1 tetratricopeptide repeat protein [Actibacterium sp. XHP0104]
MRCLAIIPALLALAAPALAETCPPAPDLEPRKSELLAAVRAAETELDARLLTNEMWELWTTAPDATAQEWLDTGIERRAAYDFEGAVNAFDALIDYCPDYAEGYNQRAFVNFIRQDYQTSLDDLERALELSPDHYAALTGKAMALYVLGDQPTAFTVLRRALDMNPWLPERHMLPPEMQPQSGKDL